MTTNKLDLIKVGSKLTIFFGEGNINNCVYHVRAIVDDDYFVLKSKPLRCGHSYYEIKHRSYIELLDTHDFIRLVVHGK